MFSGEGRVSITTEMSEDQFNEKVQEALEGLGDVEVSDGDISISPKGSLVSFMSTLTCEGKVKSVEDGYKVEVDYKIAPSGALWALTILGFCLVFPFGAAVIILPMLIDKPGVQKLVDDGLRDLKDSMSPKKKKSSASSGD